MLNIVSHAQKDDAFPHLGNAVIGRREKFVVDRVPLGLRVTPRRRERPPFIVAQDTPDVLEGEYLRSPSAREPYHLEKEDAAIIFESKVFADATERPTRESRAEHVVFRDLSSRCHRCRAA